MGLNGTYLRSIDSLQDKFDDNRNTQIIMEGYLNLRIQPWVRRIITRLIAIIPAVVVISIFGKVTGKLLILSQVILSLQLVLPLFH
jgi:manganese transport protein